MSKKENIIIFTISNTHFDFDIEKNYRVKLFPKVTQKLLHLSMFS